MKSKFILVILLCIWMIMGEKLNAQSQKDSSKIIKPYKEIVKPDTKTQKGLITVHQNDDKYYFELPFSLLGKEILVVTRVSKAAAETRLLPGEDKAFAGDEVSNTVVKFERYSSNKILVRKVLYTNYSGDSSSNMYQSVVRSNIFPILEAFNIEAFSPDSNSCVINADRFILTNSEIFSFKPWQKKALSIGSETTDKTFINSVSGFPSNVEINVARTFAKNLPMPSITNGILSVSEVADGSATYELNTSLVLLPEKPMQQRFANKRVGFFSLQLVDYDANPQGIRIRDYIKRWRLEPKSADIEKYKRGELVEPQKPIVFYIDPATPKKWVSYLIQGVNDWDVAFEQAGFKNAIIAKEAPTKDEDPTWSLYDARHSAIIYKPSEIENASGPSLSDPRTGEILESHINWYHNVMQLIHDWYFVQCAMVDPRARKMEFDDSLMGQLIRFVCSHEVGHTLGLLHNMGASTKVPVDSLRSKAWLDANGICPSIMDYARFNYVAQPQDNIPEKDLLPRIGVYDKWAIEWGYRLFYNYKTPESENMFLEDWITAKTKDARLQFINERSWDPRSQKEDLSDDAAKAGSYGIMNLKKIIPNLQAWTKVAGQDYSNLDRMYRAVQSQFETYLSHVVRNLGNDLYEDLKPINEPGNVYSPVNYDKQKKSFQFLNDNLFKTPLWLVDTSIIYRTGQTAINVIGGIQYSILQFLLSPTFLAEMYSRNEGNFNTKTYTVVELFQDLKKNIWTELYTHKTPDIYRRNLQRTYAWVVLSTLNASKVFIIRLQPPLPYSGDIVNYPPTPLIYGHIRDLMKDIKTNLPFIKDKATYDHFSYLYFKLDKTLNDSKGQY